MQEAEFQFFTNSVLHELQYGHTITPEFEKRTEEILKNMGMWECRDRHPFSLSGGQMQKLTLKMAYLSDKPIVVLDEPTAGQDAESLARCAALIRKMSKEKTVLIITHDLELIAGACDRCIGWQMAAPKRNFPCGRCGNCKQCGSIWSVFILPLFHLKRSTGSCFTL